MTLLMTLLVYSACLIVIGLLTFFVFCAANEHIVGVNCPGYLHPDDKRRDSN